MPSLTIPNHVSLIDETVISIQDVRKELPGHPSPHTVERWLRNGVAGVVLESFCIGRKRFTSREAIRRFIERTNRCATDDGVYEQQRSSRMSRSELEAKKKRFKLPESGRNGVPVHD